MVDKKEQENIDRVIFSVDPCKKLSKKKQCLMKEHDIDFIEMD